MRIFNTSGPCDPAKHYTVLRETLIAQGEELVAAGRFFTIFAPRQSGKTTYFQLLFRQLQEHAYTPVWITFESLRTLPREKFYRALSQYLQRALAQHSVALDYTITDQFDLQDYLERIRPQAERVVLVIDEFEDVPAEVLSELLHAFRAMYHQHQYYALHSLILVGVSTLAELVVSSASPFNIVDQLTIPYFTFAEVESLIGQYISESGQLFDPAVIKAIFENTGGQPGLVNGLCQHLVDVVATNRSQPVTMDDFYQTLRYFLTERFDKNILNIVQKAREKQAFMLRLLFDDAPISFTVDNPDIAYLFTHGVVDNVDGYVQILIPLYSKRLITAFRPAINGETHYYTATHDDLRNYLIDGRLNLQAILIKYRDYVRRRGFHAFNTEQLKEAAWHYSLDGFINFFIERVGGETFIEVPSGRGRTDILILYNGQKYIIETKIFTDKTYFQKGKQQLADYLTTEGLQQGYYVVFSNKHTETDTLYFDEVIANKQIITYIIRTNFDQPSKARTKRPRKSKRD